MTQKIDLNNLNKSTWETFTFEDIAQKISKTVKPDQAEVDIYIGLEHIDANDIHIRRKGVPADVKGGKLRCYPGDVIFGKRRAYQRKAAIVDFDGICSAHAFVFRANEEIIDSKLFPFFLHSDQFMHRMVDISVGGLSPTINWGDLKQQEFLLPPKEQQAKLAELLWAMDSVIEKELKFLEKLDITRDICESEYLLGKFVDLPKQKTKIGNIPLSWKIVELPKIAWFQEGPGLRNWQFKEEGIKVINVTNLVEGILDLSKTKRHVSWVEFNKTYKHFECCEGDIVIASSGNSYCKHAVIRQKDLPLMMNTSVIRFQPLEGVNYNFLNQFLKSKIFKRQIDILITGAAQPNFGPYHLNQILIPFPSKIETQEFIGNKLVFMDEKILELQTKISSSKALQKSLINQVF
ncbi:restriction endonuclease subunit S [Polaribacter sp. MSW13]|uniref:Restriction endonuclease subunit S n=1 Tax=Polaribacter marinus TaxID=2916838 RepID=A0A9X2AKS1_9FLAO|nr:restriction endonuclease subunit S [Polaribacter marinus]MCI2230397.1 restriction endonuclease subunit S [Polaribacter marinus]